MTGWKVHTSFRTWVSFSSFTFIVASSSSFARVNLRPPKVNLAMRASPPQADKLIGRMAATAAVPYWMGGCFSWASFPRGAAHTQALQGKHSSLESRCLLSRHRVHMPFSLDHSRLELDPFPLCHRRASSSERRAPSLPGPRAVKVFSPLVPFEVSNARFQARQSQLARAGSAGKLASTHTHIRTYIVHAHARLACRPACLP